MNKIFKIEYTTEDNLIKLKINDMTVEKVIDFYTEAPFPNYEVNDDKSSINYKGDRNNLAKEFKEFISQSFKGERLIARDDQERFQSQKEQI